MPDMRLFDKHLGVYSRACPWAFQAPITSGEFRAYFEGPIVVDGPHLDPGFVRFIQAVDRRGRVDVLPDAGLPVAKAKRRPITTREILRELGERTGLRIFGHRTGVTYGGSGDPMYLSMRNVDPGEVLGITGRAREEIHIPTAVYVAKTGEFKPRPPTALEKGRKLREVRS